MALSKRSLLWCVSSSVPLILTLACSGVDKTVRYVELSALNGDVVSLCLSTDLEPRMPGYLDIEAMSGLDKSNFEALTVSRGEARTSGRRGISFFNNTDFKPKFYDDTGFRNKCQKRPPENVSRYKFSASTRTDGVKVAAYHIYFEDGKATYIEGWPAWLRNSD